MIRIAITSPPGSGKSTVCRNVLKQLTCTYGGMTSADIRVKGERVVTERIRMGFEIYTVTLENRDNLVSEIALKINKAFSQ